MSSGNSCTVDSVFYDETTSQKNFGQELLIPETVKLDLLLHTKTLGNNMKSFLTLMNQNQISVDEQKQAYENIKQNYDKLIKTLEQKKQDGILKDIDLDVDLNKELEMMKKLLKEIATRITGNLYGKLANNSSLDRHTLLTYDDSHSSPYDQSSLCNHDDLMDQYQKLLNAVNTGNINRNNFIKPLINRFEIDSTQLKTTNSPRVSTLSLLDDQISIEDKQKPYVYVSGGSEDEQQQQSKTISPIPYMQGIETTSLELSYIPSTSVEHHQYKIVQDLHIHNTPIVTREKTSGTKQEYHHYQSEEDLRIHDTPIVTREKTSGNKQEYHHYQTEEDLHIHNIPIVTKEKNSGNKQEYHHYQIEEDLRIHDTPVVTREKNSGNKQEYHKLESLSKIEQKEIMNDTKYDKQATPLVLPNGIRNSTISSKTTRANDCDSGFTTNNITKFTYDSKHSISPTNESHVQSLDEGQESISSSLRSSGSDSGSRCSKYIRRFHSSTLHRKKPIHQSDSCLSDIGTHMMDTLDSFSQSLSNNKKLQRNHHVWKPQKTSSPHRSCLSISHRGTSFGSFDIENSKIKPHHPLIVSRVQSKINTNQNFDQQKTIPTTHRSSLHINHTQDKTESDLPNKFYFDKQKGVIYRYESNENRNPIKNDYQLSPQKKIHRCGQCGNVTSYQHRRHTKSVLRPTKTQVDDLGYESGYMKRSQSCRYIDYVSSSDSDSDLCPNYLQMIALNEAYNQAEKVENCSQRLSRFITRQLKLALTHI
ncbi:unnamed protein product [Adineta steineri]|uniref:Uncharacterized protein n=1 Tax=Adineta steineri TaxID=433720 RepID=A0A818U6K4_9BILA|nr:unnamed protein product [Adineta steineri]